MKESITCKYEDLLSNQYNLSVEDFNEIFKSYFLMTNFPVFELFDLRIMGFSRFIIDKTKQISSLEEVKFELKNSMRFNKNIKVVCSIYKIENFYKLRYISIDAFLVERYTTNLSKYLRKEKIKLILE